MRYEHCRVRHEPPNSYGDCLRACVASVLDLSWEDVPHFVQDNPSPHTAIARLRHWLTAHNLAPFTMQLPGEPLDEVLSYMGQMNPSSVYLLFGGTDDGDHVVVCKGGRIEWNPSWTKDRLVGPGTGDVWQVMVMGRV